MLEKGIELRCTHRPQRRRIAEAAENGETRIQLPPARVNANGVRDKLHRTKMKLREQEIWKEKLGVTAFTEPPKCGNGGDR